MYVHDPHVEHHVHHPRVVHYVHHPHVERHVHHPHVLQVDLAGVVEGGKQRPPAGDGYLIYWLEGDHFAYHSTYHSINTDQKSSGKKSIPGPDLSERWANISVLE